MLTLGNHDGEKAERLNGHPDSMPLWSLRMRRKYFPNPEPGESIQAMSHHGKVSVCCRIIMPGSGVARCLSCWIHFGSRPRAGGMIRGR